MNGGICEHLNTPEMSVRTNIKDTSSRNNRLFEFIGERLFIQEDPRVLVVSVKAVLCLANTRDHPSEIRVPT